MRIALVAAMAATVICPATMAAAPVGETYTLYRNSPLTGVKVHVATFDAAESGNYNRDNCATVAGLIKKQPGVTARYWCEKGRVRR